MLRMLLALLVASVKPTFSLTIARNADNTRSRIVNGSDVEKNSAIYPFFALPTHGRGTDMWLGCGASIISPTFALTSAHCFGGGRSPCEGPQELSLWIGDVTLDTMTFAITPDDGDDVRSVKVDAEVICHDNWDGKCAHGHDMVLLKLKDSSLPLPSWVIPVPPLLSAPDSADVTIIGYGDKEAQTGSSIVGGPSRKLREAKIQILSQDDPGCEQVYAGGYGCSDDESEAPAKNLKQQFCAASLDFKDACAGDSGSPVLAKAKGNDPHFVQVGIVSYGGGPEGGVSGPYRECGNPEWPGIYASVSGMKSFICLHVGDMADYESACRS